MQLHFAYTYEHSNGGARAHVSVYATSVAVQLLSSLAFAHQRSADKYIQWYGTRMVHDAEHLRCLLEPWHILHEVTVLRVRRRWSIIGTWTMTADRNGTAQWWLNGCGRCRCLRYRCVCNVLLLLIGLAVIDGGSLVRSIC